MEACSWRRDDDELDGLSCELIGVFIASRRACHYLQLLPVMYSTPDVKLHHSTCRSPLIKLPVELFSSLTGPGSFEQKRQYGTHADRFGLSEGVCTRTHLLCLDWTFRKQQLV
jgi:hypothetical protein